MIHYLLLLLQLLAFALLCQCLDQTLSLGQDGRSSLSLLKGQSLDLWQQQQQQQ
jgi:hypothetical protein